MNELHKDDGQILKVKNNKNMRKLLTMQEVQRKYRDVYVEVNRVLDYATGDLRFEVCRTSKTIRENMTLGQDVGTELAYTR